MLTCLLSGVAGQKAKKKSQMCDHEDTNIFLGHLARTQKNQNTARECENKFEKIEGILDRKTTVASSALTAVHAQLFCRL